MNEVVLFLSVMYQFHFITLKLKNVLCSILLYWESLFLKQTPNFFDTLIGLRISFLPSPGAV